MAKRDNNFLVCFNILKRSIEKKSRVFDVRVLGEYKSLNDLEKKIITNIIHQTSKAFAIESEQEQEIKWI